jgi:hypothetical protein
MQARHVDLRTVAYTREFCNGSRPYSLIPLLSAYAGDDRLKSYEHAFAHYCARNGHFPVSETSTESAMVGLFRDVTGV